jgi:hypothetical protein
VQKQLKVTVALRLVRRDEKPETFAGPARRFSRRAQKGARMRKKRAESQSVEWIEVPEFSDAEREHIRERLVLGLPTRQMLDSPLKSAAGHARDIRVLTKIADGLAARIERDEPLDARERAWAARALREWATQLPREPRKARGRPRGKLPAPIFMIFARMMARTGENKSAAIAKLAEEYGVTIEAVRKAVKHEEAEINQFYAHDNDPTKSK